MSDQLSSLHQSAYANKKVVVTGGAGTLGSQLVGRLVALGAHVTVIDNLSTGRIDRLGSLAAHISFMPGCISNKALCLSQLAGASYLFHLAKTTLERDAASHEKINSQGTRILYEAAAAAGVRGIVRRSIGACANTDDASSYTDSMRAAEQLGSALAAQANCSVANLRFFEPISEEHDVPTALLQAGICTVLRGHIIDIGSGDESRLNRLLAYRSTK